MVLSTAELDQRAAEGCGYPRLLHRIHDELRPSGYLEIGVRHGDSLRLVHPDTVAVGVDPAPELTAPLPPNARVVETTSDEFFAQHDVHAALQGRPLDLAFIDGMHLFEFALRDFVNIERHAHADSVVLVHDCLPADAEMASRERATFLWAGDVWKLVVCLKRYRPDLEISTVDVSPTGLGVVRNLDPTSTVLTERMQELYEEFVPMAYDDVLGQDKDAQLDVVDAGWESVRAALGRQVR